MIALSQLTALIEAGLNSNGQNINFRLFSDEGNFKKALINRTEKKRYTNGVVRVGTSAVVPISGVVVATESAVLELVVQLPNPETDEQIITAHRTVLDGYFSSFTVQKIIDNGKSYTVTTTYSLANTGTVEQRGHIGTSITFYVNLNLSYIENGLNSDEITYTLDGMKIPYTTVRTNKNPTLDSNVSSGSNGKSTSRASAFIRGWDFEMPALDGVALSEIIMDEIDSDTINVPHTLVKTRAGKSYTYSVIFANTSDTVQGIQNAGLSFSLVERAPYIGG